MKRVRRRIGQEADQGPLRDVAGAEQPHDGVLVGRDQLAAMLTAINPGPSAAVRQVAAMPYRAVLVTLLLHQATRTEQAGKGQRALEIYAHVITMAPDHGNIWWERARLELTDGDVPAARRSLAAMLEVTREPARRERVSDTLEALSAS